MTSDVVWMIVRYALLAAFSWLASRGYIEESQTETIIGAIGSLFTALWGVFVKTGTKAVPVGVANQVHIPTVSPLTGSIKQ